MMMRRTCSGLITLALCAAAFAPAAFAPPALAQAETPRIEDFRSDMGAAEIEAAKLRDVRALASQAYLWGLPAFLHFRQTTEITQARRAIAPDQEPFGGWVLLRKLATPDDRANVMPNVDTLYGASYVLLDRQGPVVLSVPRIKGRYYSVALHDAYFNTFAVVGTRSNDGVAQNVLIVPPGWRGRTPAGVDRVIRAPTAAITFYQRIFVRDETDTARVRALQDRIRLAPLSSWRDPAARFPRIETPEFTVAAPVRETRDPLRFFEIVNRHSCANPPPADYGALVDGFRRAGVGPCVSLPGSAARREAIAEGARDAQGWLDARVSSPTLRNGWVVPDPNTGKASLDYAGRAFVQLTQIGSFPPDEAMYFVGRFDAAGQPLDGRKRYALTFAAGQLPPVDPRAFWSLTMYDGATNLLVANPINRYIVRPSTAGLTPNPDGSLTLHLSRERPADAPESNWLPAPDGLFIVTLRTYLPKPAVQSGAWFPPAIAPVL
jgi:hypothetical protein